MHHNVDTQRILKESSLSSASAGSLATSTSTTKKSSKTSTPHHTEMESAKIKFLFFLGLILGAVYATLQDELNLENEGCPQSWDGFNNRCYKYVPTLMTWTDAELHCRSHGANLVSIHSQEEENFVKALIRNFDPTEGINWIGLSDAQKEGTWLWSDGSKLSFTYWKDGEPNNDGGDEKCVHTNWSIEKKWNDKDCHNKYTFVCASRKLVCSCT